MKGIIYAFIITGMLLIAGCSQNVDSFEDCVDAGNGAMDSFPPKCEHNGKTFTKELSKQEVCETGYNGTWLPAYQECEGISGTACDEMNGTYTNCASACRHDPDADICTEQCVQVCSLN